MRWIFFRVACISLLTTALALAYIYGIMIYFEEITANHRTLVSLGLAWGFRLNDNLGKYIGSYIQLINHTVCLASIFEFIKHNEVEGQKNEKIEKSKNKETELPSSPDMGIEEENRLK